jgi:hypothetical protein
MEGIRLFIYFGRKFCTHETEDGPEQKVFTTKLTKISKIFHATRASTTRHQICDTNVNKIVRTGNQHKHNGNALRAKSQMCTYLIHNITPKQKARRAPTPTSSHPIDKTSEKVPFSKKDDQNATSNVSKFIFYKPQHLHIFFQRLSSFLLRNNTKQRISTSQKNGTAPHQR